MTFYWKQSLAQGPTWQTKVRHRFVVDLTSKLYEVNQHEVKRKRQGWLDGCEDQNVHFQRNIAYTNLILPAVQPAFLCYFISIWLKTNQPLLWQIFKEPLITSFRTSKYIIVKAEKIYTRKHKRGTQHHFTYLLPPQAKVRTKAPSTRRRL